MSRRALSPAARGVLLAVSAVLRGRVATIDDQSDGTTHARVVEPDGTVLLDVRVRAVGRRDSRQIPLPLAPGPRHETPAPAAVQRTEAPAPQGDRVRVNGLASGDRITLDDEPSVVLRVSGAGVSWCSVIDGPDGEPRDGGEVYWSEVTEEAPGRWVVRPVLNETLEQQRERVRAEERASQPAKRSKAPRAAKVKPARLTPEPEADRRVGAAP